LDRERDGVTLTPEGMRPFGLIAERPSSSENRGDQTGLEPWIERFRLEFCLSPPRDFDLAALEALAA
jgi:hypothetical protein